MNIFESVLNNGWCVLAQAVSSGGGVSRSYTRWEFEGISDSPYFLLVILLAAVVVVGAIGVFYRKEQVSGFTKAKWTCAALRCLAWLSLALLILNPVIVKDIEREDAGVCVVLVDQSLSMKTVDARIAEKTVDAWAQALKLKPEDVRKLSRFDIGRRVLFERPDGDRSMVEKLRSANRVEIFGFDGKAFKKGEYEREVAEPEKGENEEGAESWIESWECSGSSTSVENALKTALDSVPEGLMAGIIMLTDGQDNAGRDLNSVIELTAKKESPVFVIGVGDPAEPKNVALRGVAVNEYVLKGNMLKFELVLSQMGFNGQNATVSLYELPKRGVSAVPLLLTGKQVSLDKKRINATLEYKPEKTGTFQYMVKVMSLPEEQTETDNSIEKRVTVLDDKIKLLLISSFPTSEYRFLKSLLERTPGFDATLWLQSQDPRIPQGGKFPLKKFPSTHEELFKYDLIILMDPSPIDFDAKLISNLEKLVSQRGAGLVWVAGHKHSSRFFGDTSLRSVLKMLPVRITPKHISMIFPAFQTSPWRLELTSQGEASPIMRLKQDPSENLLLWRRMPGFYWSFPVGGEKPGAFALLRTTDPRVITPAKKLCPVLAYQIYGAGRVVFLGSDSAWLWRKGGVDVYDRFWLQVCRNAVQGKTMGGRKFVEFVTTQREFNFGEPVPTSVRLYNEAFKPLNLPRMDAIVRGEGGQVKAFPLQPVNRKLGMYEGTFYPPGPGFFTMVCKTAYGSADYTFSVKPPPGELDTLQLNTTLLSKIARVSGGQLVTPEKVGTLADMIPRKSIRHTESMPPKPLWDRWYFLSLFILFLSAEWMIRKVLGML